MTLDDHFDATEFINVPIQPDETGQPRYPFVFLIDISESTTVLPPGSDKTDIEALNEFLGDIFGVLHSGPPDDELEKHRPFIDVAIVTYADKAYEHMPWTRADELNLPPQHLSALPKTTAMGHALAYSIGYIRKIQQHYTRQKLPKSGIPIIFHVTDGGAKDIGPEQAQLLELRANIDTLNPGGERPTRMLIYHFVTPNGYRISQQDDVRDETGKQVTGEELLVRMFGRNHVMALQHGADSFGTLVRFITKTISRVSQGKTPTAEMLDRLMDTFKANPPTPQ